MCVFFVWSFCFVLYGLFFILFDALVCFVCMMVCVELYKSVVWCCIVVSLMVCGFDTS